MKQIIKDLYQDGYTEDIETYDFNQYYYFMDKNEEIFGILKENLKDNERKLITSQFTEVDRSMLDHENRTIIDFLFGKDVEIEQKQLKYYLVKVYTVLDEDLEAELKLLLNQLVEDTQMLIKMQNIYIIATDREQEVDFYQLLKSIESDFLIKLIGFESVLYQVSPILVRNFQYDFNNLVDYKYTDDVLLSKSQLLTQSVMNKLSIDDKLKMKHYILNDYIQDQEMLKLIKVYFETNFNTSLAAKICYMHRNTFLNKLDKFINETKFNIRNYEEAFIVYLAINL